MRDGDGDHCRGPGRWGWEFMNLQPKSHRKSLTGVSSRQSGTEKAPKTARHSQGPLRTEPGGGTSKEALRWAENQALSSGSGDG